MNKVKIYYTSHSLSWLLLFIFLFGSNVQAQDFQFPDDSGQCPLGYLPFKGLCISSTAIEEKGTEVIVKEMMKFISENSEKINSGRTNLCLTTIENDNDKILILGNGAIVETSSYTGTAGRGSEVLLFKDVIQWKIWIKGNKVFRVDLHKSPTHCTPPSSTIYKIQAVGSGDKIVLNGEFFDPKLFCSRWSKGDRVIFLDGSALGVCVSATLFNLDSLEACEVWCD